MTSQRSRSGLVTTALILVPVASLHAASILWVDSVNTTSNAGAGRDPHSSWVDLLVTTGGHTLTTFDSSTYQWSLADQASKDYVASFDLVIVSRTNETFNTIRAFGANWKTVPTPMIETNPFMVGGQFQSGSWNWLASGTGNAPGTNNVATSIADPDDPLWSGVTLLEDPVRAPNLLNGSGAWFGMNGNPLLDGVTAVATSPANSQHILIAYVEPGALSATSGPRYFIDWGTGNQLSVQFNDAGKQVFLNAVNAIAIPEPATALLGGLGLLALLRRRRG